MSTGFSFGTNTGSFATAPLQNQGNFNFGGTTQPSTGFQLNIPATSTSNLFAPSTNASTGLQFGGPAATTSVNTGFGFGTGLSFNTSSAATTTNTGQGLTSATSVPASSFGMPTLTTFSSTTPLSGFLNMTTTTTNPGFTFATSASKAPLSGTAAVTTTMGPLNFDLSSNKTSTGTTPSLNSNVSTPAVVGLGGLASSQTRPGTSVTTQKEVSPKEQSLPNEILQTVEQFKEVVKQQKLHSSDIARCSVRDFRKVEQEIDLLNNLLNDVECQLQKNRHLAEKLKYDTAKCLHNVEIAQRTQDTPPGLQYENTAPLRYFLELADHFEREMQTLKVQIESADKYVKNHRNPDVLTPQDLALGMRRLHDTFVALAGRLQSVHGQVETQKDTYLNIRKQVCGDSSNPFEKLYKVVTESNSANMKNMLIYSPPKVATGPTPFDNLTLSNGNLLTRQQSQLSSGHSGASSSNPSSGLESSNRPSNMSMFGNMPFGQTSFGVPSSNFQLQKPPTGNKRGKQ